MQMDGFKAILSTARRFGSCTTQTTTLCVRDTGPGHLIRGMRPSYLGGKYRRQIRLCCSKTRIQIQGSRASPNGRTMRPIQKPWSAKPFFYATHTTNGLSMTSTALLIRMECTTCSQRPLDMGTGFAFLDIISVSRGFVGSTQALRDSKSTGKSSSLILHATLLCERASHLVWS